jgi:probable HAF family extracellular repeat protein
MRKSVLAMVRRVALVAILATLGTAVAADAGGAAGATTPAVAWEVVDLGFGPEGVFSAATAINDRGVVVGFSYTSEDGTAGHLWRRGRVVELGPGEPSDVNDHGVVAGTTSDNRGVARAAIWRDARVQLLPGIPGHFSRAEGINDRGQVVGIHTVGLGALRGYVWHRGRLQDLEPVGPTDLETAADDIDEAGTVVGYSCGDESCRPARWRNGVGEYLPLPSGGLGGDAAAIDSGQAVGSSFFRDDLGDRYEATQWDAGGDPRPLEVAGAARPGRPASPAGSCRAGR